MLQRLLFVSLIFLVFCSSLKASASICKIIHDGGMYNLENALSRRSFSPEYSSSTAKSGDGVRYLSRTIYWDLCNPVEINELKDYELRGLQSTEYRPNLVVALEYSGDSKENKIKVAYNVAFPFIGQKSSGWSYSFGNSRYGFGTNTVTTIDFVHEITDIELVSKINIGFIRGKLACSTGDEFSDTYLDMSYGQTHKELVFAYTGPKACKMPATDYLEFFSQNYIFLGLIFLTALIGMFLRKSQERLAMSFTSVQAAVMIAAGTCVYLNKVVNTTDKTNEFYFSISITIAAFAVFGFSYFSRYIAVFFVCIALSYSIVWTVLYLVTASLKVAIPLIYYLISNVACFTLIIITSCYFPQLRERYSFGVYTSITNPFFLCTSVAIYFRVYLDILTFNLYKDWGRQDLIDTKTWLIIPVQLLLTIFLAWLRCSSYARKSELKLKEDRMSSNGSQIYNQQRLIEDRLSPIMRNSTDRAMKQTIVSL